MHGKKSQIQMLETIMVLVVFFILVIFGFIFYSKVLKSDIKNEKEENAQLGAIKIAQRASSLPELACSDGTVAIDNCIDIGKLEAVLNIMNENEAHYFDKFSFSKITVNEVYPDEKEWPIYDKPLEEYSYKGATNIPISLFDSVGGKNSFGVMNVVVFSK
jgi:hypothetical protein